MVAEVLDFDEELGAQAQRVARGVILMMWQYHKEICWLMRIKFQNF